MVPFIDMSLVRLSRPSLIAILTIAPVFWGCSTSTPRRQPVSPAGDVRVEAAASEELTEDDLKIQAAGHFLKALAARDGGDYDFALQQISKAVALDPDSQRLRLNLVHLYIRVGRLDEALTEAAILKEMDPDNDTYRRLMASLLVSLRRYDEAIDEYIALSEKVPNDDELLVQLASLYNRSGDHSAAVAVLERAVSLSPDSVIAIFYLGRSYALSAEYEQALKYYKKASKLDPSDAQIHLELASVYEMLESTDKAIESYRRALEFNPNLVVARRRLGTLYVTKRQLDQALREYETLIELEEDPVETQIKMGLINLEKGDFEQAAIVFNLALATQPQNDDVRYYLAWTYEQLGDIVGAEREFRSVRPESENYFEARRLLAQLLLEDNRPLEAVAALEELLEIDPESRQGLDLIMEVYRLQKLYDRAIEAARTLVALEPENDKYLFSLAFLLNDVGNRAAAIDLAKQVLDLNPENALALNFLGYTYAEAGQNLEEAERLIKQALEIRPDYGAFVDSLGWVYFQKGDYESALRELEKANRLTADDPVIREHLADAYAKVGRTEEAIRVYRDCEARTDDEEQRKRVLRKISELGGRTVSSPSGL